MAKGRSSELQVCRWIIKNKKKVGAGFCRLDIAHKYRESYGTRHHHHLFAVWMCTRLSCLSDPAHEKLMAAARL